MSFVFQLPGMQRNPNFYVVTPSINTDGCCYVLVPLLIVSLEALLPDL